MNLHSDKEAFKEIIALAAEHFGYEQSHVEKDYWVSKILRDISLSEYADKTYFKGGTSLSKAYGLIERFSEDLDLFVFTGDKSASKQAEKTLNKKLSKYIIEQNNDIYKEELLPAKIVVDMSDVIGDLYKSYGETTKVNLYSIVLQFTDYNKVDEIHVPDEIKNSAK